MKKIFSLVFAVFCVVSGFAQKVVIKGTASRLPDGVGLVLAEAVGGKLVPRDTVKVAADGKFKTAVNIDKPTLYILHLLIDKSPQVHFMAMPNDRSLEMNLSYLERYNFMHVVSSKGSRNMELYQRFNEVLYASVQEFSRINMEYALPGTSEQRKLELSREMQSAQMKQKLDVKEIVSSYSDCLMSAFLVTFFDEDFATYSDLYEKVLSALGTKYADDQFVMNVAYKVSTSMKEGSLAPEIEMRDKDGNIRKLSDLRGKVVLIDFWASWCGPCRAELPNVVRLYNKYHDKGFDIYSVSLDKDRNAWLQAIQNTGQVWPNHVSDLQGWTSSGGRTYGVSSIPHTVLIDRKGRIIGKKLRGEELATKLKEIFGE